MSSRESTATVCTQGILREMSLLDLFRRGPQAALPRPLKGDPPLKLP